MPYWECHQPILNGANQHRANIGLTRHLVRDCRDGEVVDRCLRDCQDRAVRRENRPKAAFVKLLFKHLLRDAATRWVNSIFVQRKLRYGTAKRGDASEHERASARHIHTGEQPNPRASVALLFNLSLLVVLFFVFITRGERWFGFRRFAWSDTW